MHTGLSSTFSTGWGHVLWRRVQYAIAARWTIKAIPCRQVSRRQAVKLLNLLSLAEQGVYQFQGKWKEILASPSAWPHTDTRVSPILSLKYQIATGEICSISDQSLENRSCQQLSYTELTQTRGYMVRKTESGWGLVPTVSWVLILG